MNFTDQKDAGTVDELQKIIDSFIKKEEEYQKKINELNEQIRLLKARLFGRKSEKDSFDPKQRSLFEGFEDEDSESELSDDDDDIEIPAHKRKKRGRKPIPESLPRVDKIHDISDAEKLCECGCTKECIGQEISEQLDIIPAKIQVIRHIRPKYACKCCEGVESDGPTVAIAPPPEQLIPKCIGTPGLVAFVLVGKFVDALPFYRQEKQFLRIGVEISRATMCNWARKIAESCEILLMILKEEIRSGPLINIDETPFQVLSEPNRSSQTKSYMWVFVGGDPERPGILFEYYPTRAGSVPTEFLDGYKGIVQTDGYKAYNFIDDAEDMDHMACWAHVRRKFKDVVKAAGPSKNAKKKTGNANQALKFIQKLTNIEKKAEEAGIVGDALLKERQKKAKPILDSFEIWLDEKAKMAPPTSLLGQAITYTLNQWERLVVYADTHHVPMDNNLAENAIRPFALGRKNWLFNATPEGAAASAAIYSLIETAKANKLEPYWYLRYLFEKLPEAMTRDDFKALLPQYIDPSQLDGPPKLS